MLSIFLLARRLPVALCVAVGLAMPLGAGAQTPDKPPGTLAAATAALPTLSQALDAAWALSPHARSAPQRGAEWQARAAAAQALLSGPPSLSLAHRSDRLNANGGLREYEAELELPLWNPGVRSATQRHVASEQAAFEQLQTLARLKLAGEVRDSAAQLKLALSELTLNDRKLAEAEALATDVARRVAAGDLPRVDHALARGVALQAASARAAAEAALARAQAQWLALTGLRQPPAAEGLAANAGPVHPALAAARTQAQAAQARLALAEADVRDPMAASIGLSRERSEHGASASHSVRVALRIPLGTVQRNGPRLAGAQADLATAQAEVDALARLTLAEQTAAQAAMGAARNTLAHAQTRAQLSAEVQTLVAKSFRLGESDLPTRLRADNDSYEADSHLARARLALEHAIAQHHQAMGVMP